MTNAEWAIENRPEIFSDFNCAECVKSYDGKHCPLSEDEINDTECAKGHVEWLLKPHMSASEGEGGPVSVSDECEPAESESGPVTDADSRERLEHDIEDFRWFHDEDKLGHIKLLDVARCWLDRQAAITRSETVTECDRLRKRISELKERNCPGYDPERHYCRWHDADFELNADRLNDLKRENAKLKKRIDELNHAENAPETPERVCRTCRFSAETDPERKTLTHTCYRFPSEMLKAPDDWCGEWSA